MADMTRFRVTYLDSRGVKQTEEENIEATGGFTAREWAEDWAYGCSDKAYYELEEIDG